MTEMLEQRKGPSRASTRKYQLLERPQVNYRALHQPKTHVFELLPILSTRPQEGSYYL